MDCKARLTRYFRDNGVAFEAMGHRTAYTAQETAAAQGIKGRHVAKVVIAHADDKMVMLVMPACYRIDWAKLKSALGVQEAHLAQEAEFAALFPDCDTGAMPPFGSMYNVPVYVDQALTEDSAIVFPVGTHRDTMKVAYSDYARLAQPIVASFAVHTWL